MIIPMPAMLSQEAGTYILILSLAITRRVRVGRLGDLQLCPGYYVYIGSAFGPGGLRARIGHHQRQAKRPHWHIDCLRRHARLEAALYRCGERAEHAWAVQIKATAGAVTVFPGFGSSDCGCDTHLYWFADRPPVEALGRAFGAALWPAATG